MVLGLLMFAIFIRAVLSWLPLSSTHPVVIFIYRVTEPILDSGVVSVPNGVRRLVGERRFELTAIDGTSMGEFVVSKSGNAWGIGRFMRTRGVDKGDVIVITLDLELDVAMLQSGSRDLLARFSGGEGWGPQHFLEKLTAPER